MLVVAVLVLGCSLTPTSEDGTIVLSLSTQGLLTAKTIEPDLDMDVDHYDVYGLGPGGASFEHLGVTDTTVVQASLIPGEWEITVEAYNADSPPVLIGRGSAIVTIASGEVLSVTLTVDPIAGAGQLDVTVEWPAGVLSNPVVVGGLELDIDLQLDNPIEVSISGVPATVHQGESFTATADPVGLTSYEWYLDGVSIGTGNPLSFSTGVLGHHWLSVMVTSGGVMSSGFVEFDVTEGAATLVVALEASPPALNFEDMSYYESMIDANGFDARVVSGTDIDTLAEIQAFDVVLIGGSDGIDNDWITFTPDLYEFVSQGGGLVGSGWISYLIARGETDSIIRTLMPMNGTDEMFLNVNVGPVGSHPIMDGVGIWTTAVYNNPGAAKSGATVVAVQAGGN